MSDTFSAIPVDVQVVLARLLEGLRVALGDDLVGVYLFGSVATGDYEPGISDVDTVAVLRSDPTGAQLSALDRLHRDIAEEMPVWDERVEVVYLSTRALRDFRTGSSPAARISPGESFHAIEVDRRWLIDWYRLQEVGIALSGPPATSVVPTIAREEYVEGVRELMLEWPDRVDDLDNRGSQAYAILTMCRGLRTIRTGEHVSKREGARWASRELPQHAELIRRAVVWREQARTNPDLEGAGTLEDTRRFVMDVAAIVGTGS